MTDAAVNSASVPALEAAPATGPESDDPDDELLAGGQASALLEQADPGAAKTWRQGYPYDRKMRRKEYDELKRDLQIELLKMQSWVKRTESQVVLLFEGSDAAGKEG